MQNAEINLMNAYEYLNNEKLNNELKKQMLNFSGIELISNLKSL